MPREMTLDGLSCSSWKMLVSEPTMALLQEEEEAATGEQRLP